MSETTTSFEAALLDAADRVREALTAPAYASLAALLPDAPRTSDDWFDLLSGYPDCLATLQRLQSNLPVSAVDVQVGRYAVLRALQTALQRIGDERLPDAVKVHFADFCCEVAARERHWEKSYDFEVDPWLFRELTAFATLQWHPIDAASYGTGRIRLLVSAGSIHPISLPGFLYMAIFRMNCCPLTIFPHINFTRKSILLSPDEYERAIWLMAKAIEDMPHIKGLTAVSWVHSAAVGHAYPHLAWMRNIYSKAGAYLVETYPKRNTPNGFAYNNPRRAKLYEQGKFCPRQTLVIWPRRELLEWAARHPELAPAGEEPIAFPATRALRLRVRSPEPRPQKRANSSVRFWNGQEAYDRIGPLKYAVLVLLLPTVVLTASVGLAFGWPAAVLGFIPAAVATHAFQYFFSQ